MVEAFSILLQLRGGGRKKGCCCRWRLLCLYLHVISSSFFLGSLSFCLFNFISEYFNIFESVISV